KTAASTPDLKIGAATTIHPHAPAIEAPRGTLLARRAAALADHADTAARIGIAIVPPAIVRRAGKVLYRTTPWPETATAASHCKIGAATAIHPHAPAIEAPRGTLLARRAATLA